MDPPISHQNETDLCRQNLQEAEKLGRMLNCHLPDMIKKYKDATELLEKRVRYLEEQLKSERREKEEVKEQLEGIEKKFASRQQNRSLSQVLPSMGSSIGGGGEQVVSLSMTRVESVSRMAEPTTATLTEVHRQMQLQEQHQHQHHQQQRIEQQQQLQLQINKSSQLRMDLPMNMEQQPQHMHLDLHNMSEAPPAVQQQIQQQFSMSNTGNCQQLQQQHQHLQQVLSMGLTGSEPQQQQQLQQLEQQLGVSVKLHPVSDSPQLPPQMQIEMSVSDSQLQKNVPAQQMCIDIPATGSASLVQMNIGEAMEQPGLLGGDPSQLSQLSAETSQISQHREITMVDVQSTHLVQAASLASRRSGSSYGVEMHSQTEQQTMPLELPHTGDFEQSHSQQSHLHQVQPLQQYQLQHQLSQSQQLQQLQLQQQQHLQQQSEPQQPQSVIQQQGFQQQFQQQQENQHQLELQQQEKRLQQLPQQQSQGVGVAEIQMQQIHEGQHNLQQNLQQPTEKDRQQLHLQHVEIERQQQQQQHQQQQQQHHAQLLHAELQKQQQHQQQNMEIHHQRQQQSGNQHSPDIPMVPVMSSVQSAVLFPPPTATALNPVQLSTPMFNHLPRLTALPPAVMPLPPSSLLPSRIPPTGSSLSEQPFGVQTSPLPIRHMHLPEPPEADEGALLARAPEKGQMLKAVLDCGPIILNLMHPPPGSTFGLQGTGGIQVPTTSSTHMALTGHLSSQLTSPIGASVAGQILTANGQVTATYPTGLGMPHTLEMHLANGRRTIRLPFPSNHVGLQGSGFNPGLLPPIHVSPVLM